MKRLLLLYSILLTLIDKEDSHLEINNKNVNALKHKRFSDHFEHSGNYFSFIAD